MTVSLLYGDDNFTLRLEYPELWATTVEEVSIRLLDTAGAELLATDAATPYAGTTTAAVASRHDTTLTLHATAAAVKPGDRLDIAASAAGPSERVEVESYNVATKIATLTAPLLFAHTSGAAVVGRWCTYAADLSDAAVFSLGKQVTIEWDPDGDDKALAETAEIVSHKWEPVDIEQRFAVSWSDLYTLLEARGAFTKMLAEARIGLASRIAARKRNLDRLIDRDHADESLILLIGLMTARQQGDSMEYETKILKAAFEEALTLLCDTPSWWDEDLNLGKGTDEEAPAATRFISHGRAL